LHDFTTCRPMLSSHSFLQIEQQARCWLVGTDWIHEQTQESVPSNQFNTRICYVSPWKKKLHQEIHEILDNILLHLSYWADWLIYVRVSTIMAIWTVGHRLRSTPTNEHRCSALSLPWWSPIQVPTGLDFSDRITEQALVTTEDLTVILLYCLYNKLSITTNQNPWLSPLTKFLDKVFHMAENNVLGSSAAIAAMMTRRSLNFLSWVSGTPCSRALQ